METSSFESQKPPSKQRGFRGMLQIIPIDDVLMLLSAGRKTGALECVLPNGTMTFFIHQGKLTHCESSDDDIHIATWLYQQPRIDSVTLKAVGAAELPGRREVRKLRDMGLLKRNQLEALLTERAVHSVVSALRASKGRFEFSEGKPPMAPLVDMRLDLPHVVMSAAQTLDEQNRDNAESAMSETVVKLELEMGTVAFDRGKLGHPDKPPEKPRPEPPEPAAKLAHIFEGQLIRTYHLHPRKTVIGRSKKADIRLLEDPTISRLHAQFVFRGGHFYIQDLKSANGLMVNEKFYRSRKLRDGDEITIGDHHLTFTKVALADSID